MHECHAWAHWTDSTRDWVMPYAEYYFTRERWVLTCLSTQTDEPRQQNVNLFECNCCGNKLQRRWKASATASAMASGVGRAYMGPGNTSPNGNLRAMPSLVTGQRQSLSNANKSLKQASHFDVLCNNSGKNDDQLKLKFTAPSNIDNYSIISKFKIKALRMKSELGSSKKCK